ncbi:unnamed protein product [Leptidea sinapis]|uniref:Uncharacterized protein n=1 Tax=Leptidea sinapis TaxID=189913 RepID=A0A5E4QMI2_9NEOP|nr:unnamed protein product [Leptidea sinapis]
MKRLDQEKWKEAIRIEMKTLEENITWQEVTEVPDGHEIVTRKWRHKSKEKNPILIEKHGMGLRNSNGQCVIHMVQNMGCKENNTRIAIGLIIKPQILSTQQNRNKRK